MICCLCTHTLFSQLIEHFWNELFLNLKYWQLAFEMLRILTSCASKVPWISMTSTEEKVEG
jgi:hypothetical protein